MKVLGLILELNPFHNGHLYFIEKAKELVKPDVTVAVISTNFSMRGDIHTTDKFTKTKLLLKNNVDVVLELPFLGAVASADYFSYNAVKTLVDFNITDLAFGAEASSLEELNELRLINKNPEYDELVKDFLDQGFSYSTSTVKAISMMTNDPNKALEFSLPNNTLGIQYLNALEILKSNVNVHIVKRIDNNYYDTIANKKIASATSIRELLYKNKDVDSFIPENCKTNYIDLKKAEDNLYKIFQFALISSQNEITKYLGVNEGIENRLLSFINEKDFSSFIKKVETKRYTRSYIKRLILHIVLKVNKDFVPQYHHHLRILGMNTNGKKFVSTFKKGKKSLIITTYKNKEGYNIKYELLASRLYSIITEQNGLYLNEFKIPIIGE